MRSALALGGWLMLCFSAAAIGGAFTPGDWYAALLKPSWNPPNWLFGPVWSALYTLMAIAAWLVWKQAGFRGSGKVWGFFLAQLALNAAWSPLFFGLRNPGLAFAEILVLWVAILGTISAFWRVQRWAAVLLLPYAAWVSFAAVLNLTLWQLNR